MQMWVGFYFIGLGGRWWVIGVSERFLFLWLVGFGFQRLVLLSVRPATAGAPFDQCDLLEEELEAAQSKASN
jgi:hypothetical protein